MPTFTAIALDSLLEPGSRNPNPNPKTMPAKLPPAPVRLAERQQPPNSTSEKRRPPRAASPILYATPDVTPLPPDSPSSFPPSPYIVNHKRRGPRLLKSLSQDSVVAVEGSQPSELERKVGEDERKSWSGGDDVEDVVNGNYSLGNGVVEKVEVGKSEGLELERDGMEIDDFYDFQDAMSNVSLMSSTEGDEGNGERSWKQPSTPAGDYYDAFEEISSDGTSRSSFQNIEDELREMRLNLLMQIEKRKQAEEALEHAQSQWHNLSQHLSLVGLTLPALPATANEAGGDVSSLDPAEELCCQVVVTRAVADSIGRACSRAEVEMEMEPQIESKNFEIARLWDRLQYYEATNREMSQRNQEAVEMARQHRHQRKRRQRWIWGSIGLAVTLGTAAIVWSYIPSSKPSAQEGDSSSASHGD